ncbi:MAG TPA: DNA polymerase III subunit delta' [Ktedonobacterales bacterium]
MRGVFGAERACALVERALASGETRHAYLFTGPEGVGKSTLALAFARALLCQRRLPGESDACGECLSCRKVTSGNHPDLLVIEAEKGKRWIKIEALRAAEHLLALAPSESERRVAIIPEMGRVQPATANTLLKTLEEPPPGVVLILAANEASEVLPTILSRCQVIPISPTAPEVIARALRERWGVEQAEAERLVGLANGRLGWAVRAHERPEEAQAREEALAHIAVMAGRPLDERMRAAAALGSDNASARVALDLWSLWWRDVTLAANGAPRLLTFGEPRRAALRLGPAIGPERARLFLERLLAAQATLDVNANPRLTLESLALDLPTARPARA